MCIFHIQVSISLHIDTDIDRYISRYIGKEKGRLVQMAATKRREAYPLRQATKIAGILPA
jgi:hypothetical protein